LAAFTAVSVDSVKKIFNEKAKGLNDASNDRSLFLDNERYDKILREVKEAQILQKNNQPLTSKHYRRRMSLLIN
jgi:UDP-3-O-[3-hydroxymyristoyl] glucosamine N-acyltransferase